MINPNLHTSYPDIVDIPLPEEPGLETAQIHAAMAEDLLLHAHTLEDLGQGDAALGVFEQATDEFFVAHQTAGNNVKELGPEFFEGLADAEEAIAESEGLPTDTREIAALHSISSIEQAISVGGLGKVKARRLRIKQRHLKELVDELDENVPQEVIDARNRPAATRLRDARTGHNKLKAHTDRIRRAGALVADKFFSEHTSAF